MSRSKIVMLAGIALILVLTACSSDAFLSPQELDNRNTCLAWAENAGGKWRNASLEQIYDDRKEDNTLNQKTFLATVNKALKVCEAVLTPPPPRDPRAPPVTIGDMLWKFSGSPEPEPYTEQRAALSKLSRRIEAAYVETEKKQFLARSQGRVLCGPQGSSITDFVYTSAVPSEQCIYGLSDDAFLKVFQATPDGILVTGSMPEGALGRIFYLYSDNPHESSTVDGGPIAPGYFIYTGGHSYVSLTGPHRLYGFRRITNPFTQDMLFYDGR